MWSLDICSYTYALFIHPDPSRGPKESPDPKEFVRKKLRTALVKGHQITF